MEKEIYGLNKQAVFIESFLLDVLQGFEYVSAIESLSSLLLNRIPYVQIIIQNSKTFSKNQNEHHKQDHYLLS